MRVAINLVGFQIGWFACILGASNGMPWLGPVVVASVLAVHLWFTNNRFGEMRLLATAGGLGYVADSTLVLLGLLTFPETAFGRPSPIWMVALWMNFAATLNVSLRWLRGRNALAALLGAAGGPVAYFGGHQLGAIELVGLADSLSVVAVEWAVATPLLLYTARRRRNKAGQRRPRALAGQSEVTL